MSKQFTREEDFLCRGITLLLSTRTDASIVRLAERLELAGSPPVSLLNELRQAIPLIEQHKVDLLVLILDGLQPYATEITLQIRQRKRLGVLPILLVAQSQEKTARNAALAAGANDYVDLDADTSDLAWRLRNLLALRNNHLIHQASLATLKQEIATHHAKLEMLIENGMMMSMEQDQTQLLRHILQEGQRLLHCTGGTLYLVTDRQTLYQKTLHFALRTRNDALPSLDIPLYDPNSGAPNEKHVSTWVALHKHSILIDNVYQETRFDLSGTRHFDAQSGYRTISMLTVPMAPRGGKVIGVLQFMNAQDPQTGEIIPFAPDLVALVEALAAQAAVALDNLQLVEARQADAERRLAQERLLFQQSRLAAMGEMVGNIAHQWRQPLNVLSLLLANIRETSKRPSQDEASLEKWFIRSQQTIQRMSDTIEDFLNYFKPDKEQVAFDVCHCINSAIDLVELHYQQDQITISPPPPSEPCLGFGYPNEFTQVVLNALSNAREAILARGIAGTIRISLAKQNDTLTVTLDDNGGGIPSDILPKVFDPYFTTKNTGTGIGLYMSKTIMQNMGGDIGIGNGPEGARVQISLPQVSSKGEIGCTSCGRY